MTYSAPGQLLNPNNVIAFPTALLWAIYILVGSMYLVVLSSERESKMTYFLSSSLVTFTLCNQYLVWKISCLIFSHETRLLNYGSNDIFWIFLLMNLLSVKSLHFNITWGFSIFFCFLSWHRPHSFCVSECIWTHWSYRRENCLILNQIVVLYSDNCGFVFCCVLFAGLNNNTVPYICKHLDLLKVFLCVFIFSNFVGSSNFKVVLNCWGLLGHCQNKRLNSWDFLNVFNNQIHLKKCSLDCFLCTLCQERALFPWKKHSLHFRFSKVKLSL